MNRTHTTPIAHMLLSMPHDTFADDATMQAVRATLAESPASQTACIDVSTQDGIVTLDGTVSDSRWLARFKNQVTSALPGIIVADRLDWVIQDCSIGLA